MEESEEGTFHNKFLKFVKLHLLASAYGLITLVQWLCMLNWAPWEPWGTTNTIATMCSISIAISIFTIYCVVTCLSLALPQFLEWILALLLVECLTIAPSGLVIQSSGLHFAICLCAAVATSATFSLVGFGLSKHVGTGLAIVVFIWSAVAIGFIAISIFVGFLLSSLAAFYICITVAYVTIILFIIHDGTVLGKFGFKSLARFALDIYCGTYCLCLANLNICWFTDLDD